MIPIQVVPYDPRWPAHFQALHGLIWPRLAEVALSLEHVGSTSVPGLAAKPVIDLTLVVADTKKLSQAIERLTDLGFHHRGDLGITGREAFRQRPDLPPHHLYAAIQGAVALRNHLAVRDALRRDQALARQYSELKQHLAAQHIDDMDAYVEGKSAFLQKILAQSGFSAHERRGIERLNRK